MKDFRFYDLADFVMDEDFIRWVHGKADGDNLFWNSWLDQNPTKHLLIAEARQIVESMRLEQRTISPQQIETEISNVLRIIGDRHGKDQDAEESSTRRRSVIRAIGWRAAVAVLILAVAGVFFFHPGKDKKLPAFAYASVASSPSFTETFNSSAQSVPLVLPDGTAVQLAAGSRISYPKTFETSNFRDVYLVGEAFFKVTGNPRRPFRVIANEIVTRVLGTSFSVRCFEKDSGISVTVRSGKVSVSDIIVTPNQRLVYQPAGRKFQKTLIDSPSFIVPDTLDHSMVYEEKPVEQVFDQLSKYYGVNIVYDNAVLSKCTVTADLSNESFYHKLDLICKAIGANYELLDGQVVIQSYGCQ